MLPLDTVGDAGVTAGDGTVELVVATLVGVWTIDAAGTLVGVRALPPPHAAAESRNATATVINAWRANTVVNRIIAGL